MCIMQRGWEHHEPLVWMCAVLWPLWALVGKAITALMRQPSLTAQTYRIHAHSAIYSIIFMIFRFHSSMPARLWHGYKILKEICFTADSKDVQVEPSSLIGPGCWDIWLTHEVAWSHYTIIKDEMQRGLKVAGTAWPNWYNKFNVHGCTPSLSPHVMISGTFWCLH